MATNHPAEIGPAGCRARRLEIRSSRVVGEHSMRSASRHQGLDRAPRFGWRTGGSPPCPDSERKAPPSFCGECVQLFNLVVPPAIFHIVSGIQFPRAELRDWILDRPNAETVGSYASVSVTDDTEFCSQSNTTVLFELVFVGSCARFKLATAVLWEAPLRDGASRCRESGGRHRVSRIACRAL